MLQQLINEFVDGNHGISCPAEFGGTNDCTNAVLDCSGECLAEIPDPNTAESHSSIQFKPRQRDAGLLCYAIHDKF
jgi:hypothetical protein